MNLNEEQWNESKLENLVHFADSDLSVLNYVKFLLLTSRIFSL